MKSSFVFAEQSRNRNRTVAAGASAKPRGASFQLAMPAFKAGAELLDVAFRRPSLEDVLIELTGRPRTGA
jgi:hypothetical protein